MDSLFIGPYRQNNINGYWSNNLLHRIYENKPSNVKLIARNTYIDSLTISDNSKNPLINDLELYREDLNITSIVQHVPVDAIYLSQQVESNICFPILTNKILKQESIDRLNLCTKIIVENQFAYSYLSQLLPRVYLIENTFNNNVLAQDIDLGIYSRTIKMYFIGSYSSNRDIIFDLILTFVLFSLRNDNMSLIIYLIDGNNQEIEHIKSFTKNIYDSLKISNIFPKVLPVSIPANISNIINCHKTGNIFLNINDDSRHYFHSSLAKHFGNNTLELIDLEHEYRIMRNDNIADSGFICPTQAGLATMMENIVNDTVTTKQNETHRLEDLLWN